MLVTVSNIDSIKRHIYMDIKSNICKCREGGKIQIFGAKFQKFLDLIKIGQYLIFFLFVFAEKNVGSVLSS